MKKESRVVSRPAPQEVEEDKATIKSFVRNKSSWGMVNTHWGTREQNWTQYSRGEEAELESHSEITNHCESRPVSHFLKRRFIIWLFLLYLVLISLSRSQRWHLETKSAKPPNRHGICQMFYTSEIPKFFNFTQKTHKLHLTLGNFIEKVIFRINSWKFYPNPKISYTSAICDKFHVCTTYQENTTHWYNFRKARLVGGSGY